MPIPRYGLALFPRSRFGGAAAPEPMYFDSLEAAFEEHLRHPDCAFEIRDHHDDERIVGQGY
jgi:hypothetical protein